MALFLIGRHDPYAVISGPLEDRSILRWLWSKASAVRLDCLVDNRWKVFAANSTEKWQRDSVETSWLKAIHSHNLRIAAAPCTNHIFFIINKEFVNFTKSLSAIDRLLTSQFWRRKKVLIPLFTFTFHCHLSNQRITVWLCFLIDLIDLFLVDLIDETLLHV
jgi:hypothetical protein